MLAGERAAAWHPTAPARTVASPCALALWPRREPLRALAVSAHRVVRWQLDALQRRLDDAEAAASLYSGSVHGASAVSSAYASDAEDGDYDGDESAVAVEAAVRRVEAVTRAVALPRAGGELEAARHELQRDGQRVEVTAAVAELRRRVLLAVVCAAMFLRSSAIPLSTVATFRLFCSMLLVKSCICFCIGARHLLGLQPTSTGRLDSRSSLLGHGQVHGHGPIHSPFPLPVCSVRWSWSCGGVVSVWVLVREVRDGIETECGCQRRVVRCIACV